MILSFALPAVAVAGLALASRAGYGAPPRVFFALALAFAIAGLGLPHAAAASAAAIFLILLGGITFAIDRRRLRIER